MSTNRRELIELKAAASAGGIEWGESQKWYEGRLEGKFIVAPTDKAPMSGTTRTGPASVRPKLTVQVDGREYAIGKDRAVGVLFARVDP